MEKAGQAGPERIATGHQLVVFNTVGEKAGRKEKDKDNPADDADDGGGQQFSFGWFKQVN